MGFPEVLGAKSGDRSQHNRKKGGLPHANFFFTNLLLIGKLKNVQELAVRTDPGF
jgi:hypothetical protein